MCDRRDRSAIKIQTCWRGISSRSTFCKLIDRQRRSASVIQTMWKSYRLRTAYLKCTCDRRRSAIRIQSMFRSMVAFKILHQSIASASKIQAFWRGFDVRSKFKRLCTAATRVAMFLRKALARQQLHVLHLRSVSVITSYWRSYRSRCAFLAVLCRRRQSAICIQSFWRSLKMLSKLESALYLFHRSLFGKSSRRTAVYALLVINQIFRSSKAVRFLSFKQSGLWKCRTLEGNNLAAAMIQCFVRGCLCRMKLERQNSKQKHLFCMLPFKKCCELIATSDDPPVEEKLNVTLCESRTETRVMEVLFEQAELFSSFAVSALLIVGNDASFMGNVNEFFDTPCLRRLTQSVLNSRSSLLDPLSSHSKRTGFLSYDHHQDMQHIS